MDEHIKEYLISNQENMSAIITPYYILYKDMMDKEDPIFRSVIRNQFIDLAKSIISESISRDMVDSNPEIIMSSLESFDLWQYLNLK